MSTVIQQPDALSFSSNLKTFEISSSVEVSFVLEIGATVILDEKYFPDNLGIVSVRINAVVERLLDIAIPATQAIVTEQITGILDFTATIDGLTPIVFKVLKGGVDELDGLASDFLTDHFLTWQPKDKTILQTQPEWLGIYAVAGGLVKLKAYYANDTTYTGTFATLTTGKLYSINTSWPVVSAWLLAAAQSGAVLDWDVWYEVGAVQKIPVQRYRVREAGNEEHRCVWANTLGGIDSVSFTGGLELDYKLIHKTALYEGNRMSEYDIDNPREFRQSTGYLERREAEWIADFFYSCKKYVIRGDGTVKGIAIVSSGIVDVSGADEVDYEFSYRYAEDLKLLNLDRLTANLAIPQGLNSFFLTEQLSSLPTTVFTPNLLVAVQNPFSPVWMQLPLSKIQGNTTSTTSNVTLTQDVDFSHTVGTTKPKFVQVFNAAGDELGFRRTFVNGVYGIIVPGTDAQSIEINVIF